MKEITKLFDKSPRVFQYFIGIFFSLICPNIFNQIYWLGVTIWRLFCIIGSAYGIIGIAIYSSFIYGITIIFFLPIKIIYHTNFDLSFVAFIFWMIILLVSFPLPKYKSELFSVYPSTRVVMEIAKILVCKKWHFYNLPGTSRYLEIHFKPTCILKRTAKKSCETLNAQFLSDRLSSELEKIIQKLGNDITLYGLTAISVPGLVKSMKNTDSAIVNLIIHEVYQTKVPKFSSYLYTTKAKSARFYVISLNTEKKNYTN